MVSDLLIRLEVNNQLISKYIHNVIGTMYGDKDSGKSLLLLSLSCLWLSVF